MHIWDAATGTTLATYHADDPAWYVAWSPDGKRVAATTAGLTTFPTHPRVIVLDAATGNALVTYTHHSLNIWAVSWSPNGRWLASAAGDRTVQIWDSTTGAERFIYTGHHAPIFTAVWSPDGTRIASGGADNMVQIWQPTLPDA